MTGNHSSAETVLDVLGDDLSRRILVLASVSPVSAAALAERLDASKPTIYRRLNELQEYDLVAEDLQPDRGAGNHHKRFETTVERATIEIEDGGLNVDLALRRDLVGASRDDVAGSAPEPEPADPPDPAGH